MTFSRERLRDRRCGYRLVDGKLEWIGQEHFEDDVEWTTDEDLPRLVSEDRLENPRFFGGWRSDRLLLSVIGTQPFLDLSEGLRASCVYNFSPPATRTHQPRAGRGHAADPGPALDAQRRDAG